MHDSRRVLRVPVELARLPVALNKLFTLLKSVSVRTSLAEILPPERLSLKTLAHVLVVDPRLPSADLGIKSLLAMLLFPYYIIPPFYPKTTLSSCSVVVEFAIAKTSQSGYEK